MLRDSRPGLLQVGQVTDDRAYFRASSPEVTLARLQEALTDSDQAMRLLEGQSTLCREVQDTRGCVLLRLGKPAAARAEFNRALARDEDPQTLFHRAEAYYRLGDRRAARADVDKAKRHRGISVWSDVQPLVRDGGEFERFCQAPMDIPEVLPRPGAWPGQVDS